MCPGEEKVRGIFSSNKEQQKFTKGAWWPFRAKNKKARASLRHRNEASRSRLKSQRFNEPIEADRGTPRDSTGRSERSNVNNVHRFEKENDRGPAREAF